MGTVGGYDLHDLDMVPTVMYPAREIQTSEASSPICANSLQSSEGGRSGVVSSLFEVEWVSSRCGVLAAGVVDESPLPDVGASGSGVLLSCMSAVAEMLEKRAASLRSVWGCAHATL